MGEDLATMRFEDEAAAGYGSPEDVPAEAIDNIVHAAKDLFRDGTRPTLKILSDAAQLATYLWKEFASKPAFGAGLAGPGEHTGAEILAEIEAIGKGKPPEAVSVGVILKFLWALVRFIK